MSELDFDATYRVDGYDGIAWRIYEYIELCNEIADGEWEWFPDTSRVIAVMVGDNRHHTIDVDDLTVIDDEDYCHTCGQIGCGHG